ncbi:MAG: quinone oxidoreductase [Gemmatimonadetes bacterium]|nr:quinone oxidoreductase [Gemmatimonadota bacterium]
MKAVRIHTTGGPEVLRHEDVPQPAPGPGQAAIRVEAAGVNYIDTYHRSGLYRLPLPATLGQEGAGTVTATGSDVTAVRPGDRVAWTGIPGSYADYVVAPADRLVSVPNGLSLEQAAATMLQGMTAHYLACATYPLGPGDTCLVHAAAGGVGLLLTQIAKLRGARVIGTVSTDEKARLAREAGADHVIRYTEQDFEADVKRLTENRGVQVVYDSVGRTTFEKSLNCLARRGLLVLFGQSSGPVPPFDPQVLNQKGSLFFTRPSLVHYITTREELLARATELYGWIAAGKLTLRIHARYPLGRAADAHRDLEGRKTTGKLLLIPGER